MILVVSCMLKKLYTIIILRKLTFLVSQGPAQKRRDTLDQPWVSGEARG